MAIFQELDELFHQTLFVGLEPGRVAPACAGTLGPSGTVRRLHLTELSKVLNILAGHRAIVGGIASGTGDQAVNTIRDHVGQTVAGRGAAPGMPALFRLKPCRGGKSQEGADAPLQTGHMSAHSKAGAFSSAARLALKTMK